VKLQYICKKFGEFFRPIKLIKKLIKKLLNIMILLLKRQLSSLYRLSIIDKLIHR